MSQFMRLWGHRSKWDLNADLHSSDGNRGENGSETYNFQDNSAMNETYINEYMRRLRGHNSGEIDSESNTHSNSENADFDEFAMNDRKSNEKTRRLRVDISDQSTHNSENTDFQSAMNDRKINQKTRSSSVNISNSDKMDSETDTNSQIDSDFLRLRVNISDENTHISDQIDMRESQWATSHELNNSVNTRRLRGRARHWRSRELNDTNEMDANYTLSHGRQRQHLKRGRNVRRHNRGNRRDRERVDLGNTDKFGARHLNCVFGLCVCVCVAVQRCIALRVYVFNMWDCSK